MTSTDAPLEADKERPGRFDKLKAFYEKYRNNPAYLAIVLGAFALICAFLLASGQMATEAAIQMRLREDLQGSLSKVIPTALHDNDLVADAYELATSGGQKTRVFPAFRNNQLRAIAYQVSGIGYGGPIDVLIAVDMSGTLLGARILQHAETPGLGDRIEATRGDWITQFDGLSLTNPVAEQWKVKKDGGYFDQLSGATITPRTVVRSVLGGLKFFNQHRAKITTCPRGKCEETGS